MSGDKAPNCNIKGAIKFINNPKSDNTYYLNIMNSQPHCIIIELDNDVYSEPLSRIKSPECESCPSILPANLVFWGDLDEIEILSEFM